MWLLTKKHFWEHAQKNKTTELNKNKNRLLYLVNIVEDTCIKATLFHMSHAALRRTTVYVSMETKEILSLSMNGSSVLPNSWYYCHERHIIMYV